MRRGFMRRMAGFALLIVLLLVLVVVGLSSLVGSLWGGHFGRLAPLVLFLIVVLIGIGVARSFRRTMAPVGELIEASARVEAGQLGTQVSERGSGEVRSLSRAFNAMSRRLAEGDEQRRRLLAEVSHELRTPLTVIQGTVEGMLDGLYPADHEHLERIQAETRRLEHLIEDLRTLSLTDAGALQLHREPSDLAAIARDAVAGFQPQADASGVTLRVEAPQEVPELELDPQRMHQVVANLVSNALRHTPAGGEVVVTVASSPSELSLSVHDTGWGMSRDAAAHAFERFWRSGPSAGAGLGLAIVRDLAAAHGGSVDLASEEGNGTTVEVRLPAATNR